MEKMSIGNNRGEFLNTELFNEFLITITNTTVTTILSTVCRFFFNVKKMLRVF